MAVAEQASYVLTPPPLLLTWMSRNLHHEPVDIQYTCKNNNFIQLLSRQGEFLLIYWTLNLAVFFFK